MISATLVIQWRSRSLVFLQLPPHSQAEESAYLSALDHRILSVHSESGQPFMLADALVAGGGAAPELVLRRARALRLSVADDSKESIGLKEPRDRLTPELHALDYEWYFTRATAEQVADALGHRPGEILLLGAPTVASVLDERGVQCTLVDRNPLVRHRFNFSARVRIQERDLTASPGTDTGFAAVFLDPPWYPAAYNSWLSHAVRAAGRDALIAFALFPVMTRPSGRRERRALLEQARSLGEVEVRNGALSYETPLFERKAYSAVGLHLPTEWRRADLVVIHLHPDRPSLLSDSDMDTDVDTELWDRFVLGEQVVMLRQQPSAAGPLLQPVPGVVSNVFTSVSSTAPNRQTIDLWTSRNKVARVGDRITVAGVLRELERGAVLNEALVHTLPGKSTGEYVRLIHSFQSLLDDNSS